MKESPRRYTNPFLSDEDNENVNLLNNQELDHSNIKDGLTNNCEDEKFRKSLEQSDVPPEFFKKETELYTDKNIMECELPEVLVCYNETPFHVKDICVDDGIPHGERILSNEGKHGDKIEDGLHIQILKPELLRFTPTEDYYVESNSCSGTNEDVDTDLPVPEATNNHLDIRDNCEEVIERNLDIQVLNSEDFCTKSDGNMGNNSFDTEIPIQDLQNSIPYKDLENSPTKELGTKEEVVDSVVVPNELKNMSKDDNNNEDKPSKSAIGKLKFYPESDSVPKTTDSGDEQINSSGNSSDNASKVQVASNRIPSLQQDRPLPSLKSLLESMKAHDIDQQPSEQVHKLPIEALNHQEVVSNNVAGNNASGLISYSGPIAFSGSASLRSDSSTTSTRSFAFPILQTEWNSSPVRMAKADRRRLQKLRGWRHGLLCCRF